MNKRIKADINSVINKIENGVFEQSDIKAFLIDIRDFVPGDSVLRELSNFIAHPKKRDRGDAFKHIEKTVQELLAHIQGQGDVNIGPVKGYSQEEIVNNICTNLNLLKFDYNEDNIRKSSNDILLCVACLLQDVDIDLKISGVISCTTGFIITEYKQIALPVTLSLSADDLTISFVIIQTNKKVEPDIERYDAGQFNNFMIAKRMDDGRMSVIAQ